MKVLKTLFIILLTLILAILLFWLAATVTLQSEKGRGWVMGHFVSYIEKETNLQVEIGQIDFLLPFSIHIQHLNLYKDEHPIVSIQQLDAAFAMQHLLNGRIVLFSAHVEAIKVHNFLFLLPSESPSSKIDLIEWTKPLPFYVRINDLAVKCLEIDPSIIDAKIAQPEIQNLLRNAQLSLKGSIGNNPFRSSILAHLSVGIQEKGSEMPPLYMYANITPLQLDFRLQAEHAALQRFFPQATPHMYGDILVDAAAKIKTWDAFLNKKAELGDAIEGSFKTRLISETPDPLFTPLIGQELLTQGKFQIDAKENMHLQDLNLKSSNLLLQGDLTLASTGFIQQSTFKAEILDLNTFFAQNEMPIKLSSPLLATAHVQGFLLQPSLWLYIKNPMAQVKDITVHDLESSLQVSLNEKGIHGTADIDFVHEKIPSHVSTHFIVDESKVIFNQLNLNALNVNGKGHITFHFNDFTGDGKIEIAVPELTPVARFFDLPLQGKNAQINLTFQSKQKAKGTNVQQIECAAFGNHLQWQEWQVEQVDLNIYLEDEWKKLLTETLVSSDVSLKDLKGAEVSAKNLLLQTSGTLLAQSKLIKDVVGHAHADSVKWNAIESDEIALFYQLKNPVENLGGKFEFNAQNFRQGTLLLSRVFGKTQMDSASQTLWPFQIKGAGVYQKEISFETSGLWHSSSDGIEIGIESSQGTLGPYPFQLTSPFHLVYEEGKMIKVDALEFSLGKAAFRANLLMQNQHIDGQFRGEDIPSEFIDFIATDVPIKGTFSFYSKFNGPLTHPNGQLTLLLHQVQLKEDVFANSPVVEGEWNANLGDAGLNVEGKLYGLGKNPVHAKGVLPLVVNLENFDFKIADQFPFHLNFQGEGELSPFLHFFYNDSTNLIGQARFDIMLSGNIRDPQIQGGLDLYEGTYESYSTGAIYKNINARIEGSGTGLVLKHFSAQDIKQGSITADGSLSLNALQDFPFEFHIHPSKIFIMNSDYASITASGSLILSGTKKEGTVSGTLDVDHALISMEEALPTQVKSVEFKYINVPKGEANSHPNHKESSWPLQLNVVVNMPNKVMIRGKNLESEWKGSVAIQGTPSQPLLNGELRVISGAYDFNSKKFNLSQGTIHFAGAADKKTSLYVVASREIDRIRADIIVKGLANKLEIGFRSNPPMSQREILSYILFNRGIADITSDQSQLLTHSFVELNSSNNSEGSQTDLLTRLRNNIGIDRLDFTATGGDQKELSVQVGKYISENVFVSYNKSINAASNRVAIEAKLRKNLQAQAEVGIDDGQGKILLKWKKDY